MDEEVRRREADLHHLERMLGMRSGHGGGLSATMGLSVGGEAPAALLPGTAQIREAIGGAGAAELRAGPADRRGDPRTRAAWPADAAVRSASQGGAPDRGGAELFADPPPAAFSFIVVVFLTLLHAKEPALEELEAHLGALEPATLARELRMYATSRGSDAAG